MLVWLCWRVGADCERRDIQIGVALESQRTESALAQSSNARALGHRFHIIVDTDAVQSASGAGRTVADVGSLRMGYKQCVESVPATVLSWRDGPHTRGRMPRYRFGLLHSPRRPLVLPGSLMRTPSVAPRVSSKRRACGLAPPHAFVDGARSTVGAAEPLQAQQHWLVSDLADVQVLNSSLRDRVQFTDRTNAERVLSPAKYGSFWPLLLTELCVFSPTARSRIHARLTMPPTI